MAKLIAGSDVSGDVNKGQHRHIAFVIGREEDINTSIIKLDLKKSTCFV